MAEIEISKETFARLQKHAVPLVDTIETVVTRILDFYEKGVAVPTNKQRTSNAYSHFSLTTVPDLRHTKVISAELAGEELHSVNWNSLLIQAIKKSKFTSKQTDELKRLIIVNFVVGRKEDEGYRHLPNIGISVQGQDANSAAKAAFHIAQRFRWPLKVEFLWRDKEGAARPGEIAVLANELVT